MTKTIMEKALALAVKVHTGQKDKGGKEYILHPLRLMSQMETEEEQIVALLHDVVEDSSMTIKQLAKKGFDKKVLKAVKKLTFAGGKHEYDSYIAAIRKNPIARKVKLADLKDNLDLTRIENTTTKDLKRIEKYLRAYQILKE